MSGHERDGHPVKIKLEPQDESPQDPLPILEETLWPTEPTTATANTTHENSASNSFFRSRQAVHQNPDVKPEFTRSYGISPASTAQRLYNYQRNMMLPLIERQLEPMDDSFIPGTSKRRSALSFGTLESIFGPPDVVPPSEVMKARKLRKLQAELDGVDYDPPTKPKTVFDEIGDWDWDTLQEEMKVREAKEATQNKGQATATKTQTSQQQQQASSQFRARGTASFQKVPPVIAKPVPPKANLTSLSFPSIPSRIEVIYRGPPPPNDQADDPRVSLTNTEERRKFSDVSTVASSPRSRPKRHGSPSLLEGIDEPGYWDGLPTPSPTEEDCIEIPVEIMNQNKTRCEQIESTAQPIQIPIPGQIKHENSQPELELIPPQQHTGSQRCKSPSLLAGIDDPGYWEEVPRTNTEKVELPFEIMMSPSKIKHEKIDPSVHPIQLMMRPCEIKHEKIDPSVQPTIPPMNPSKIKLEKSIPADEQPVNVNLSKGKVASETKTSLVRNPWGPSVPVTVKMEPMTMVQDPCMPIKQEYNAGMSSGSLNPDVQ